MRPSVLLVLLLATASGAQAATCVWNAASGNWSAAANWSGCADAPGPSTRPPGEDDIAVVVSGTVSLDASPAVAGLELGAGGILSVVGGTKTVIVTGALRLNGGKTTTQLGTNQLILKLQAGGTGMLLAPTTMENATFFENSGVLALGSTNATALTLLVASEVRNMPGGTITIAGGHSRVNLQGSSKIVNNAGATLTIAGNTLIGESTPASSPSRLINFGQMSVTGPGTLSLPMGSNLARFQQFGDLTVSNATVVCSTGSCRFEDWDGLTETGAITTRLSNAAIDLGAASTLFVISEGSTLSGTGTLNASLRISGTVAPGALTGTPYGTLTVNGHLDVQASGMLDFDLGGASAGSRDRIDIGGTATVGGGTVFAGRGRLNLRLAAGYAPALGAMVPIIGYAGFTAGSAFNRIDANYALDYAARFDPAVLNVFPAPRISIEDVAQVEGASGTAPMTFTVRLSQPIAQTVSVEMRPRDGSAVYGSSPNGDFLNPSGYVVTFAPGVVEQPYAMPIHGDSVVEADEAFSVELYRSTLANAAIGTGVTGNPVAVGTILTDELPPDTRFVLVGKDNGAGATPFKIRRYTTTGVFIDAWDTRMTNGLGYITTGMCFSPEGDVLATRFAYANPIRYSRHGAVLDQGFGGAGFNRHESCVFDRAGNVYVGQAGISGSTDAQVPIRKFDPYGVLLEAFVVPTGERGTDWIDLAGDQCTLYYTSEDTTVRRYNLCTQMVLPPLPAVLTAPHCYALRLRPNRELMVACQEAVHRLDPDGEIVQTYTRQSIGETDPAGLFALNLDPDGTSFWTAGLFSGNVYRVDIETGTVLASFNSGAGGVSGLAVYDELGDDVIFADDFEPPPTAATDVACSHPPEQAMALEGLELPHFMPAWLTDIIGDCR